MDTVKNREIFPVGTRVKPAYDKLTTRVGTVIEHARMGDIALMRVRWDDQDFCHTFMKSEIRREGGNMRNT